MAKKSVVVLYGYAWKVGFQNLSKIIWCKSKEKSGTLRTAFVCLNASTLSTTISDSKVINAINYNHRQVYWKDCKLRGSKMYSQFTRAEANLTTNVLTYLLAVNSKDDFAVFVDIVNVRDSLVFEFSKKSKSEISI